MRCGVFQSLGRAEPLPDKNERQEEKEKWKKKQINGFRVFVCF